MSNPNSLCTPSQEKSQIKNLTLQLKQLKKDQIKPKVSKRKEIIKIRAKINEKETKQLHR